MKIMYPTLKEQLAWLNTIQTDFHCHSQLLLMMQENNGYLLLILESINKQLKQRVVALVAYQNAPIVRDNAIGVTKIIQFTVYSLQFTQNCRLYAYFKTTANKGIY